MKVFISWSGEKSRKVGELLRTWLKCVLQATEPWMSSEDIEGGTIWFEEINNQLRDTAIGIVCLTRANKSKPWILFESGALAKGLSSNRVCTFLVDLENADVGSPLGNFNHTSGTEKDVRKLVSTINGLLGERRLDAGTLENVFQTYWPQFDQEFRTILESEPSEVVPEPRESTQVLAEILEAVRGVSHRVQKLERGTNNDQDIIRARNMIKELVREGWTDEKIRDVLADSALPADFIDRRLLTERSRYGAAPADQVSRLINMDLSDGRFG